MHIKTFFKPGRFTIQKASGNPSVTVIIPSYSPENLTLSFVRDIAAYHPDYQVLLVDDSTPASHTEAHQILTEAARLSSTVTVLRTPTNKLKAGAINYALEYLQKHGKVSDIIVTADDDVHINEETIPALITALSNTKELGAVCSQSYVLNKNINLLTRLQALEHLGFNVARLADEGFFYGPLVMPGMLTAFKAEALLSVGSFDEQCLIEDYQMTVRLKERGWHVAMIGASHAGTTVPETVKQLWKQRVRWIYGGLTVASKAAKASTVIQDMIGHVLYLSTFALILLSLFFSGIMHGMGPPRGHVFHLITTGILTIALVQLGIGYIFQLWMMRLEPGRDYKDWIIRILLVPEFVYANALSLILIGSYLFFAFNKLSQKFSLKNNRSPIFINWIKTGFGKLGFTETWGTKTIT